MSRFSVSQDIVVMSRKDADPIHHFQSGTVGQTDCQQAEIICDMTGLVWQIRAGDQVAVVDIRELLLEAARILLERVE